MVYPSFNLIIIAWGFFFFVLILSAPHGRPLAKYMLLVFIVVQMVTPLGVFIPQQLEGLPAYMTYRGNLFYLSGPAFYFYIKALRSPSFRLKLRHLWCFLPVFIMPNFFRTFLLFFEGRLPVSSLHLLLLVIWFLAFLIAGLRRLPINWWSLDELLAPRNDTIWRWLYVPILFYIGVYMLRLIQHTLEIFAPSWAEKCPLPFTLTLFTRIVFLYFVAIGSYRHRHLHEIQDEELPLEIKQEPEVTKEKIEKYSKSSFDEPQLKKIWLKLNTHMLKEEPFRDPCLKLAQLAQELGVTANGLSQVINVCAAQNYYDFINQYRVEKARTLIEENANSRRSMLDISMEAGFGNTGTFYKYFKMHFLVTPHQYRKSCQSR